MAGALGRPLRSAPRNQPQPLTGTLDRRDASRNAHIPMPASSRALFAACVCVAALIAPPARAALPGARPRHTRRRARQRRGGAQRQQDLAVGYSFITGANLVHAMINDRGTVTDIGTLGGTQKPRARHEPSGVVVGWAYPFGRARSAFRWEGGVMTPLGTFGGNVSDAQDVNASGVIVGSAFTDDPLERAFWWDGALHGLGTLGGSAVARTRSTTGTTSSAGPCPLTERRPLHAFLGKPWSELYDLARSADRPVTRTT